MNSIELSVAELLEMAETPLYSMYRYVGKTMGGEIAMGAFLSMIDDLMERDVVELWHTDSRARVRERLPAIPEDLEEAYREVPDLDPSYDPFSLTLTLGSEIGEREPEWEVAVDFPASTFVLTARPDAVPEAFTQMARLYDRVELVETRRSEQGSRVRVEGALVDCRSRVAHPARVIGRLQGGSHAPSRSVLVRGDAALFAAFARRLCDAPAEIALDPIPDVPELELLRRFVVEDGAGAASLAVVGDDAVLTGSAAARARVAEDVELFLEHNDLSDPGMHAHIDPADAGGPLASGSLELMLVGPVPERPQEGRGPSIDPQDLDARG